MINSTFKLTGLNCEACVKIITKRLMGITGVAEAGVLLNGDVTVTANQVVTKQDVASALTGLEYKVL